MPDGSFEHTVMLLAMYSVGSVCYKEGETHPNLVRHSGQRPSASGPPAAAARIDRCRGCHQLTPCQRAVGNVERRRQKLRSFVPLAMYSLAWLCYKGGEAHPNLVRNRAADSASIDRQSPPRTADHSARESTEGEKSRMLSQWLRGVTELNPIKSRQEHCLWDQTLPSILL